MTVTGTSPRMSESISCRTALLVWTKGSIRFAANVGRTLRRRSRGIAAEPDKHRQLMTVLCGLERRTSSPLADSLYMSYGQTR